MKIGVLSTIDNPLLGYFLEEAYQNNLSDMCVILDSKLTSQKDIDIWNRRTIGSKINNNANIPKIYDLKSSEIPFYLVDSHNSRKAEALYRSLEIKCLFNAGTPRKISQKVLDSMTFGVLNVHPGILPIYRGCSCVEWAILNDDEIGNTAHLMDAGYDTGPIIDIEKISFPKDSKYVDIRSEVYIRGYKLAVKVLENMKLRGLRKSDMKNQTLQEGKYWEPIPIELEKKAINKANNSNYRYQLL